MFENHKGRPLFNEYSFVAATILVSRKVKIRKFKILYFKSERHYRIENLLNDFFLGHLQPSVDKNSEDLIILSLEFYDVTCKPRIISNITSWKSCRKYFILLSYSIIKESNEVH